MFSFRWSTMRFTSIFLTGMNDKMIFLLFLTIKFLINSSFNFLFENYKLFLNWSNVISIKFSYCCSKAIISPVSQWYWTFNEFLSFIRTKSMCRMPVIPNINWGEKKNKTKCVILQINLHFCRHLVLVKHFSGFNWNCNIYFDRRDEKQYWKLNCSNSSIIHKLNGIQWIFVNDNSKSSNNLNIYKNSLLFAHYFSW